MGQGPRPHSHHFFHTSFCFVLYIFMSAHNPLPLLSVSSLYLNPTLFLVHLHYTFQKCNEQQYSNYRFFEYQSSEITILLKEIKIIFKTILKLHSEILNSVDMIKIQLHIELCSPFKRSIRKIAFSHGN